MVGYFKFFCGEHIYTRKTLFRKGDTRELPDRCRDPLLSALLDTLHMPV
jgi:hypothetical protein